jgi:hypothetical protein
MRGRISEARLLRRLGALSIRLDELNLNPVRLRIHAEQQQQNNNIDNNNNNNN